MEPQRPIQRARLLHGSGNSQKDGTLGVMAAGMDRVSLGIRVRVISNDQGIQLS